MCFLYVFCLCVLSMCLSMYFVYVFCLCVLSMCFVYVFCLRVLSMCFVFINVRRVSLSAYTRELFFFQVAYRSIGDRVLKLTVYDVDRQKKHNLIGHALYPLKDHGCETNERLVIWRDLEREVVEVNM